MNPANEHRLAVGESMPFQKNIFAHSASVFYCGVVNDNVFSIAVNYAFGNHMMAYNLYFPVTQREIKLKYGTLTVKHVNEECIVFSFTRN